MLSISTVSISEWSTMCRVEVATSSYDFVRVSFFVARPPVLLILSPSKRTLAQQQQVEQMNLNE
jgi:hypothetical protein